MDAKACLRYGYVPMRLLLFFSALFAALAGVGGTRAVAQPVQASALLVSPGAALAAARTAVRFTAPAFGRIPPAQPPLPRLLGSAALRLLYAERRRE